MNAPNHYQFREGFDCRNALGGILLSEIEAARRRIRNHSFKNG